MHFRRFYEHPFRSTAVFILSEMSFDLSSSHVYILVAEVSAADPVRGLPFRHFHFVPSFLYGGIRRSWCNQYLMEDEAKILVGVVCMADASSIMSDINGDLQPC